MLIDFSVENYRSFLGRVTLSLVAQPIRDGGGRGVADRGGRRVLRSLAVYGANSSGKSNLAMAILAMRQCVLSSVRLNSGDELPYDPFLLLDGHSAPTAFEATFLAGGYCYRYGFSYTRPAVASEWLFRKGSPRSKEVALFVRDGGALEVDTGLFAEGDGLAGKVNGNRLFLSLCGQLGGEVSNAVINWFQDGLKVVSGLSNDEYHLFSKMFFHRGGGARDEAMKFFRQMRLGFDAIETREVDFALPDGFPKEVAEALAKGLHGMKDIEVKSVHRVYGGDGLPAGSVALPFDTRESAGTRKLFDLAGYVFAALADGSALVIDELDAKMHPLLSLRLVRLFNDAATNPRDAQLIFTTHDTHLLNPGTLRRDQVWFTEKNDREQTDLYCLTDLVLPDGSKPRNDANHERNYIRGRYGAVPYITWGE